MSGRIDTHHHVLPAAYRAMLVDRGETAGGRGIPEWTAAASLDLMDSVGVDTAVLSVSTPGVHFGDDREARRWARDVNDDVAEIVRDHPMRFGFFATLTLPDVDGALAELDHAMDQLHADGVILLTNAQGVYLGDARFEPLFAELARRETVVFVHPGEPPMVPVPGVPPFAADFMLDTTRAAINLARSGTLLRHPDLQIILSHAGGFLPYVADRVAPFCVPDGWEGTGQEMLRRFHFDLALSSGPSALPSLLGFADPTRITYGSDFPYAPVQAVRAFRSTYEAFEIDPEIRTGIDRSNAERIFPRLASAMHA